MICYKDSKMHIAGYGTNTTVYRFINEAVISTTDTLTIDNLVTRVKILGKADDDGRSPVEALVDGDTSYGVLQTILKRDSDKTLDAATAEANTILREKGKPEETISVTAPDLPFLRKGDAVEMAAGNLLGIFYTEGVSHDASKRTMTLTLTRSKGDSVITTSANYLTNDGIIGKKMPVYLGTMPKNKDDGYKLVNDRIR